MFLHFSKKKNVKREKNPNFFFSSTDFCFLKTWKFFFTSVFFFNILIARQLKTIEKCNCTIFPFTVSRPYGIDVNKGQGTAYEGFVRVSKI